MLVRYLDVTNASGSRGGTTAARNRGGNYWRARTVPINPSTGPQADRRAAFGTAAVKWAAQTDADRATWNTYADSLTGFNRVGTEVKPSGMNCFVATNSLWYLAGESTQSTAPTSPGRAEFSPISSPQWDLSANTLKFNFNEDDYWVNNEKSQVFVYIGKNVSNGVNFYKGPFQLSAIYPVTSTPPTSPLSLSSPTIPFGEPSTGTKTWIRVRVMDDLGRISLDQIQQLEVVP